jgi:hypothetical protein
VKIGRTSENDVVLHDHGVSRRHALITARGGKHFVTDLGSANGTLFNGKPLVREQELHAGDRLTIGSVEFVFTPLTPPPVDQATRLVDSRKVAPRTSTRITRAVTEVEMQAIEAENTGRHRTVTEQEVASPAPAPAPAPAAVDTAATLAEMPAVLLQAPAPGPVPAKANPRPLAREASSTAAEAPLSAAERARQRRQAKETLGGQLLLWWKDLSPTGKSVAGVITGLVVVGLMMGVVSVFLPSKAKARPTGAEPSELSLSPLPDSFGLGQDVTWKRPDLKAFDFQFISPTRAVVVLHYQANNISPQEVTVSLNGVEQGWVPADTSASAERDIELILALKVLKRSERNQLVFDNVKNPPGQESWRISNVYVEVIPVPELPTSELLSLARKQATAGQKFYELKDVGSENLFKAWKAFRSAWITLEALEDKPDLYNDVRFSLSETSRELDQQCRKLMLDFQRNLQFRDGDKAVATVQEVMRRFPTTEHRCHNLAIEKATEYELPI